MSTNGDEDPLAGNNVKVRKEKVFKEKVFKEKVFKEWPQEMTSKVTSHAVLEDASVQSQKKSETVTNDSLAAADKLETPEAETNEIWQAKLQLSASIVESMATRWLTSVGAETRNTGLGLKPLGLGSYRPHGLGLGAVPDQAADSNDSGLKAIKRSFKSGDGINKREDGVKRRHVTEVQLAGSDPDDEHEKGRARKVVPRHDPFAKKVKQNKA